MKRIFHLLSVLHWNKPRELLLPLCQTLWIIWLASIGQPNWINALLFIVITFALFSLFNLSIEYLNHGKKPFLSRLHTIEIAALLVLLIITLLSLTNWFTLSLSFVSIVFFAVCLTLIRHRLRGQLIFYALTWAWFSPLIYTASGNDLQGSTLIVLLTIMCFVLLHQSVQHWKQQAFRPNVLWVASLNALLLGLLILMGMLTGQATEYFICLLIVLVSLIYQVYLISHYRLEAAYRLYPYQAVVIFLGIVLSYHL